MGNKEINSNLAQISDLLESLDRTSRSIVTYLAFRRHANIDELANTTGIPHHDILRRLTDVIIPQSKKVLGKPAISFEKSRIDTASGEMVTFSWWINESLPVFISNFETFGDNGRVFLVADVPGLDIIEPIKSRVHYRNSVLQIELCNDKESVRNMAMKEKSMD